MALRVLALGDLKQMQHATVFLKGKSGNQKWNPPHQRDGTPWDAVGCNIRLCFILARARNVHAGEKTTVAVEISG